MALPLGQVEAVIAHHTVSCLLGHPYRRGGRDEALWNDACDYAVNGELLTSGFDLPEGSLIDPRFKGEYSEQVYSTLFQEKPQPQDDGGGDDGEGEGDGAGGDQAGGGQQEGDGDSSGSPDADAKGEGKGNASTGETRDAESDSGQAMSEAEAEAAQAEWKETGAQAAQIARGKGMLPGDLERFVEQMLNPVVDWREVVQHKIQSRAKSDYNWSRPNRRYAALGICMPSLDVPHCGPLAVAVDMSGSIDQKQLDQFVSELTDVMNTVRPERLIVMPFDTQVRDVILFEPGDEIELKMMGGGGTAFDGPAQTLDALDINPEILIFLTDLQSSVFGEEPPYPVVWVTTDSTEAPFGDVVEMF